MFAMNRRVDCLILAAPREVEGLGSGLGLGLGPSYRFDLLACEQMIPAEHPGIEWFFEIDDATAVDGAAPVARISITRLDVYTLSTAERALCFWLAGRPGRAIRVGAAAIVATAYSALDLDRLLGRALCTAATPAPYDTARKRGA